MVRPVDLHGLDAGQKSQQALKKFFRALGKGNFGAASALATDPIDLFGTPVSRATFATGTDTSLGRVLERLDALDSRGFSPEQQEELFGGRIGPGQEVFFVKLALDDGHVSYGVVTASKPPRIARLFDPGPFKRYAASLDSTAD